MGRKKKTMPGKVPYKLRRRRLADGRESLFLDRSIGGGHQYEFLKLYLLPETTKEAARQNARTLRRAEEIVRERTEALVDARAEEMSGAGSRGILLSDWMQTCIEIHQRRGLRDMAKVKQVRMLLLLFRADAALADIDRLFCLDFIDWLRNTYVCQRGGTTLSPSSANGYCQVFRTSLNYAVRAGLIERNPWSLLEKAEKIRMPESRREFLTIDELKKLIATPCLNESVRHAFLFSCFTGLRISDVRKLLWKDITTTADGKAYMSVLMQKTSKPVHVPLSRQALKWMPRAGNADPESPVFEGLPNSSNVSEIMRKWTSTAGMTKRITYHSSRHTFATMMLTLGADIYTVSKLLGHSSVRNTQIYAKIVDRKKDEAADLVDMAFRAAGGNGQELTDK